MSGSLLLTHHISCPGGVVYTACFQSLLPKLGFPWTVRALGFLAAGVFATALPALLLSTTKDNDLQHEASESTTCAQNLPNQPSAHFFDTQALRNGPFLAYSISSLLIFLAYLVPFFYIPLFAQAILHMSRSLSYWVLAISAATSIFGRLLSAYLAKRIGIMMVWTAATTISGCLCLSWIAIQSASALIAFSGLYGTHLSRSRLNVWGVERAQCPRLTLACSSTGFFSGALVALPPAIFPRICTWPEKLGTWMGMGWLSSGVAFLVGSPIAGALLDTSWRNQEYNFLATQLWSGLLLLSGAGSLLVLWRLLVRNGQGDGVWI